MRKTLLLMMLCACAMACTKGSSTLTSPNGKIKIEKDDQCLEVSYKTGNDWEEVMTLPLEAVSSGKPSKVISVEYDMLEGKRLHCTNRYREMHYTLADGAGLDIRAYDDGIAWRGSHDYTVDFSEAENSWLMQWSDSYENFFIKNRPLVPGFRLAYPALFEYEDGVFALLSESDMHADNAASSFYFTEEEGVFDIRPDGPEMPGWQTLIIGKLSDVVESTLITDNSEPCKLEDTSWIEPGVASWVYWAYNHGSNDLNIIKRYVDLSVALGLPYVLIDAEWDEMKDGYTVEDAIKYATDNGVKPIIWYSSSIGWLDGAPGPKFRLNKPEDREKEFAWCESLGVKGVKIDFFSGDTQENMSFMTELLESAAKHHLLVNFHGATTMRGWQRTYPNLITTEAVYGAEWYNNLPFLTDRAAGHNATLPFTRNVLGSMDYTPCAFTDSQHPHITTHAHELALTALFESGIQHLADRPESFLAQPVEVKAYLGSLPTAWDETRYISGYPGESAVLARRSGDNWYIAGINGTDEPQALDIAALASLGIKSSSFVLFADGEPWDISRPTSLAELGTSIECKPRGGFVLVCGELIEEKPIASPVVNPDNTVTFNYRNDTAKDVKVSVQFAGEQQMAKGADGIWSVTLGPAEPDMYPYCFIVDGVQVMDPVNPDYFPNETFKNSIVDIRGTGEPLIHALKDVPHGSVDYVNYWSETLGMFGKAIVYTPPTYDQNPDKQYPVFYLISGTTDTEEVYFKVGRMNLILDNLLAEDAAKEMIIVLPYGNPSNYFPAGSLDFSKSGDMFSRDLLNDLMPFVESNYRTLNDREHRAVGGFSRGGNQGLAFGLTNLDKFAWLCSYSSFTSTFLPGSIYDDVDRLNKDIRLFWLGVGTDDFLYGNAKDYMDFLDARGINNIKCFTTDKFGHTWMNAKYFLDKSMRLLFQDEVNAVSDPLPAEAAANDQEKKEEQMLTPAVMARLFPTPVVSPEYNADGSVTFRVRADEAANVELESQMFKGHKTMVQNENGIWEITVKPETPDIYPYAFVIDGTPVADPCNMYISPNETFKYSLADVRAAEPGLQDIQNVPQGKVSYRFYHSETCGTDRQMCVYTPAGYDPAGKEKLPVLYLLHGDTDTPESWFKIGHINTILDNLIAQGLAKRMIVVMPYTHPDINEEISHDIIPFIESNYNVLTKAKYRAFAGYSYAEDIHTWMDWRDYIEVTAKELFK